MQSSERDFLCRNTDHGKADVKPALQQSLKDLRLTYLDLYLVMLCLCMLLSAACLLLPC